MSTFYVRREVELEITAEDAAKAFCDMDSGEQAIFFNTIAHIVKTEWSEPYSMQMQHLTDDEDLTDEGREIMSTIGNYSRVVK